MKFAIGDQAVDKAYIKASTSYQVSKVVAIVDGNLLLENYGFAFDGEINLDEYVSPPGTRGWREHFARYQEDELFTPAEAVAELRRLEAARDKLSEEFAAVRDQVKDKLNQAATLVKEAGEIAKFHDRDFYQLKTECMPLYRALEDGGWSHSHMSC